MVYWFSSVTGSNNTIPEKPQSKKTNACSVSLPMIQYLHAMGREMMIMARFVPKDKLSKKAQKELNRQRRTMWDFSPVSRAVDSKKLYNRKRNTRDRYDDYGASVFHCVYAGFRTGRQIVALCMLKHNPACLLIGRIIASRVYVF